MIQPYRDRRAWKTRAWALREALIAIQNFHPAHRFAELAADHDREAMEDAAEIIDAMSDEEKEAAAIRRQNNKPGA